MRRLIAAWASASADEDDLIGAQSLMDPSLAADVCSPFTGWILFMQLNGACFDDLHKVRAFFRA